QLSGTDGGIIYEYDEATEKLHLRASHQTEQELVEALRANPIDLGVGTVGRAAASRMPVQITDILDEPEYAGTRLRPMLRQLGYRSLLAVPLLREDRIMGGLSVFRREAGSFSMEIVDLLQNLPPSQSSPFTTRGFIERSKKKVARSSSPASTSLSF